MRKVPFSRVIYIEQDDFREVPPPKYYRLAVGREIRLRYAYFIKCTGVVKDEKSGEVTELRCTYDPQTRGGDAPDGRKVKATLHWVSAEKALPAEVRLYDHLFAQPNPSTDESSDYRTLLNRKSLEVLKDCFVEPSLANAASGSFYQFERLGYFCVDPDSKSVKLVFNRTVNLKDEWAKIEKGKGKEQSKKKE
jgi:glutaminyl-tRNA synthetase